MFNRQREMGSNMGMFKDAVVGQQKAQTVAYVALGVSIAALFLVFAWKGKN